MYLTESLLIQKDEVDDNILTNDDQNLINNNEFDSSLTTRASQDNPQLKSDVISASLNLGNTIIGAGIIGLPYALQQSGFVSGILMMLFVGLMTAKSSNMLIELCVALKEYKISSLEELLFYPFGTRGKIVTMMSMFIFSYGVMIAYLLIIKDTLPTLFGFDHDYEPEIVLSIVACFLILPFSLQKDMASLAIVSSVSMLCDVILIILLAFIAPISINVNEYGGIRDVIEKDIIKTEFFVGLGIMSTAMCCQQSLVLIYKSLENNTRSRWWNVTFISISFSTLLCLIVGIVGYLGYMEDVEGNILNNLSDDNLDANVARAFMGITMILTYPIEFFVARHVLISAWSETRDEEQQQEQCCLGKEHRLKISFLLFVLTLFPALLFNDLGFVLSFTGSTAASSLAYILPGVAYLGIHGEAFLELIRNNNYSFFCSGICYYMVGLPLWKYIATRGSEGVKSRCSLQNRANNGGDESNYNISLYFSDDIIESNNVLPTALSFMNAIFFISFGLVAFLAGFVSSIYILKNE